MKKLIAVLVAVVAVSAAASAQAAQPVKSSLLSKMGLGKMQVMSDSEGLAVRGMGYVNVSGSSTATVWGRTTGATSTNSYDAYGHHFAAGVNVSAATNFHSTAIAGGFSAAVAH